MKAKTLQDLLVHGLSDIYSAEKQLLRALPQLARSASEPALAEALRNHQNETEAQLERIDKVADACGLRLRRMKCAAMEGLIDEAKELIDEISSGPVLDAGLIGAVQKMKHYEIATYGTLAVFAQHLELNDAIELFEDSLEEEKAADAELSALAEQRVNEKAEAATEAS